MRHQQLRHSYPILLPFRPVHLSVCFPLRRREAVARLSSSSLSLNSALHRGTVVRALARSLGVAARIRYRPVLLTHTPSIPTSAAYRNYNPCVPYRSLEVLSAALSSGEGKK